MVLSRCGCGSSGYTSASLTVVSDRRLEERAKVRMTLKKLHKGRVYVNPVPGRDRHVTTIRNRGFRRTASALT